MSIDAQISPLVAFGEKAIDRPIHLGTACQPLPKPAFFIPNDLLLDSELFAHRMFNSYVREHTFSWK
jgi:hypothetical protein